MMAEPQGTSDLKFLEGTWVDLRVGSMAWCKVSNGRPRFLYSYGGDGAIIGEFHEWERSGTALRAKFRWFAAAKIRGVVWYEVIEERQLRGGWWMDSTSAIDIRTLPHENGMMSQTWYKQDDRVPERVLTAFKDD